MLRIPVLASRIRNIPSVFCERKKILACFSNVSRFNHDSLDSTEVVVSTSEKSEKQPFNSKAILDLCLEKFDDDLLYFPEILKRDEWANLVGWGQVLEEAVGFIKYDEILSNNKIPDDVLHKLKSLKLFGKRIPKEYGGLELTETENSYIQEILGIVPSIARLLAENEEMGIKTLIKYGSEEQKQKYLPKLAKGDSMISFAFMEQSSSLMDFKSFMGLEIIHKDDMFTLQGSKKWVYNAKNADVFIVLGTESVLDGNGMMLLNTVFLVDKNTEGIRVNQPVQKNWFKGLDICEVVFDEVVLSSKHILGGYGKGSELFQDVVKLNKTTMLSECTTALKRLLYDATEKSKTCSFMGKPISSYQFCEYALGELACLAYAAESVTYYLAARADYYEDPDLTLEIYLAKIFVSEAIPEALQIYFNLLGKYGYSKVPFVEELVQNAHYYSIIDDSGFDLKLFIMGNVIQYAVSQLKPKLKELSHPEVGLLATMTEHYRSTRLYQDRGVPKLDLSQCVHRFVEFGAKDLEYCLSRFKYTSENNLHKFGNKAMKNDYDLIVLCDVLMNIYALIACIARASRAGFLSLPDAEMESKLARLFSTRTVTKIRNISSLVAMNEEELETCAEIGRKAINSKEYQIEHPLMRNF